MLKTGLVWHQRRAQLFKRPGNYGLILLIETAHNNGHDIACRLRVGFNKTLYARAKQNEPPRSFAAVLFLLLRFCGGKVTLEFFDFLL